MESSNIKNYKLDINLIPFWWECKMMQPLWKTVWGLLTILNIHLQSSNLFPNEFKSYVYTENYT